MRAIAVQMLFVHLCCMSCVGHDREPFKTAEPMPFGVWTHVDPRNHVLDVGHMWAPPGEYD